mgnify:CR=1 FL=1
MQKSSTDIAPPLLLAVHRSQNLSFGFFGPFYGWSRKQDGAYGGGLLPLLSFASGPKPHFVLLPPLVAYLWICARFYGGTLVVPTSWADLRGLLSHVSPPTLGAAALYGGWFLFQLLLQLYVPGPTVYGTPLEDGTRLPYRMNGWAAFLITLAVCGGLVVSGLVPATLLADQAGPLITVVTLFSFVYAVFLYFHGRARGAKGTGSAVYDYFIGMALNPRSGALDHKLFCESRPGLILWVLLDLSLLAKQRELHGAVSNGMILVCLFQLIYVADYYFHEEAILTTWDIKYEHFGWMLCFGDLAWVPFTYSLQATYLLTHPQALPGWAVVLIVLLNAAGYVIFRGTNLQKHRFRRDPEALFLGRKQEYLRTSRGSLLLTSGFWGVARHLNYLGDLLMALAWCLTCGTRHLLPYFYIIYFTALLVHRERRDHDQCARKYGADWDAYCAKVRWRILPGIY